MGIPASAFPAGENAIAVVRAKENRMRSPAGGGNRSKFISIPVLATAAVNPSQAAIRTTALRLQTRLAIPAILARSRTVAITIRMKKSMVEIYDTCSGTIETYGECSDIRGKRITGDESGGAVLQRAAGGDSFCRPEGET